MDFILGKDGWGAVVFLNQLNFALGALVILSSSVCILFFVWLSPLLLSHLLTPVEENACMCQI